MLQSHNFIRLFHSDVDHMKIKNLICKRTITKCSIKKYSWFHRYVLWYQFVFQHFGSKCLISLDLSIWSKPMVLFGRNRFFLAIYLLYVFLFIYLFIIYLFIYLKINLKIGPGKPLAAAPDGSLPCTHVSKTGEKNNTVLKKFEWTFWKCYFRLWIGHSFWDMTV